MSGKVRVDSVFGLLAYAISNTPIAVFENEMLVGFLFPNHGYVLMDELEHTVGRVYPYTCKCGAELTTARGDFEHAAESCPFIDEQSPPEVREILPVAQAAHAQTLPSA